MSAYDVVIAGAGSVGVPLSYYCAKRGLKVLVLDREASWGRGQNRAAIGGVRATFSDPAKIRICTESLGIVSSFEEEHGLNIEWRRGGYLFVAYDEELEKAFRELLAAQRAAGLDIDWIGPERVAELTPGINPEGLRGGTFSPGDGYASPLKTSVAFHRLASEAGVEFRFGEDVVGLDMENKRVRRLNTSKDSYEAGLYVDAAGAQASEIAAMAGAEIPVHPDCHEGGVTEPMERFMEPMLVDIRSDAQSGNYYFYQTTTGQVVFCITPKPQVWGTDVDSTSSFLPLCARRMLELYPRLRSLKVRRTWRGMYPMTPDGQPIVGYSREAENLLLAVGMCGQGFMIGPGLGKILSEVIVDGVERHAAILDQLTPYRKFEGMEMLK
ncbi:MAG: FAD-binding oxidoreductase [Rectinemataceae bacterium]